MRTCELAPSPVSFSLPTCECVANKERRAQLLLVNVFHKLVPVLCMSGTLTQPLCQHRKVNNLREKSDRSGGSSKVERVIWIHKTVFAVYTKCNVRYVGMYYFPYILHR